MRFRPNAVDATPGGITMLNSSLKAAIQWAYHLQAIQVIGPNWIDSNRYDIVAKTSEATPNEKLREMLRALLADRFKLAVHRETKEMQAYIVTIGKNGHKMKPSEGEGEMEVKPTGKGLQVLFTHVTLAQLSEMAQSPLQGIVVDQTGLQGAWDFTLDMGPAMMMQRPETKEEAIGMMIQIMSEQLGIKIDQKKTAAEVLVIERAEKIPAEN
jgi:uncharacterized protein (TIGR03435 family)